MVDQSLLSEGQDRLMFDLNAAWEVAQADRLGPSTCMPVAKRACDALVHGGTWPDTFWIETILMMGANACAVAVLNHGQYDALSEPIKVSYQEVLSRKWLKGGPTGHFDENEAAGLSRAVAYWQAKEREAPEPPPARRRLFGR